MTTIQEAEATQILSDMQQLADRYDTRKLPGEFTTGEYADALSIPRQRSYTILASALEDGRVTVRRVGRWCYWRIVK